MQYRYEGNIFSGEKRMELLVVPRCRCASHRRSRSYPPRPSEARRPPDVRRRQREVRVTVINDTRRQRSVRSTRNAAGMDRHTAGAPVTFEREDEAQTVRFDVRPGASTTTGSTRYGDRRDHDGRTFGTRVQVVEYPHITRHHIYDEADDSEGDRCADARNLTVGYVMGVGDQVPPAIEQLGAKVELIDADELAWGNLSRFDAIVTGVRAYERRADLRAHNHRLLEYAVNGGTVIVQYNKFEFNDAQYGPYPAKVSADRITDENAPPQVLDARATRSSRRRTRSARRRGRTGCRSAGCTSWASRTRGITIWCSWRTTSRTTGA